MTRYSGFALLSLRGLVLGRIAVAQAPPPPGTPAGGPPPEAPAAPFALPPLPPDAPKPSPDPRNLEGTWFHGQPLVFRIETDMYGSPLPFTVKGRRIRDRRVKFDL